MGLVTTSPSVLRKVLLVLLLACLAISGYLTLSSSTQRLGGKWGGDDRRVILRITV